MARNRTRVRRTAVAVSAALFLALTPATAHAADTQAPTAGTGGGAVSVTTGVIAILAALYLAWRRGALAVVLLAIAAGAMLSGTQFADTIAELADHLIRAAIDAVSGIFT